jgi:hypothetical protein
MDDIVQQAMAKWPNVPDCYGWLGLDARGRWYLRDDAVQAAGPFPASKGELLAHEKLLAFIGRNYLCDTLGRWFFQNGPQRVFVELEVTPWIWRIEADFSLRTHTGQTAVVRECLLDEDGRVYLHADCGLGLVHTLDTDAVARAVEVGRWVPREVQARTLSEQYAFCPSPAQDAASRRDTSPLTR